MYSSDRNERTRRFPQNPLDAVEDVKARLSFSAVKTPIKRPLMNHNYQSMVASSPSPDRHAYLSKMGEYHMSRQNPDILDRMYDKALPTPGVAGVRKTHSNLKAPISHTPRLHQSTVLGPYVTPADAGSPPQMSLLRRMLNTRKIQNGSPQSVVQMALQGGRGRGKRRSGAGLLKTGVLSPSSPVVVTLGRGGKRSEERLSTMEMEAIGQQQDPCNAEVVLEALRQKRKRVVPPTQDNPQESSTSAAGSSPSMTPNAKRFKSSAATESSASVLLRAPLSKSSTSYRHSVEKSPSKPLHWDIARSTTSPKNVHFSQLPNDGKDSLALTTPTVEHVNEKLELAPAHAPHSSEPADTGCSSGGTSFTPILIEEEKMKKKRDDSLRVLTTVFASKDDGKKDPLRRKYPVFCATGVKPYMPAMSSSHQITHENLQKEREATAARLRAFLEGDEKESQPTPTATTTTITTSSSKLGTSVSSKLLTVTTSSAVGGVASSTSGQAVLQLKSSAPSASSQKQHMTKSVSFAPLLTQAMTTALTSSLLTSTIAATGDQQGVAKSSSSSLLLLQKPSLTTVTSSTATLPSVSASNASNPQANNGGVLGLKTSLLSQSSSSQSGLSLTALSNKSAENKQTAPEVTATAGNTQPSASSSSSSQQSLNFSFSGQASSLTVQPSSASIKPAAVLQTTQSSILTSQSSLFSSLQKSAPSLSSASSLLSTSSALSLQSSQGGLQPAMSLTPVSSTSINNQAPTLKVPSFQLKAASSESSLSTISLVSSQASVAKNIQTTQSSIHQNQNSSTNLPTFQVTQSGPMSLLFQTSQSTTKSPLQQQTTSQPSLPQATQPSSKPLFQFGGQNNAPTLFQSTQTTSQPSLMQATQATSQPSLLQANQPINKLPLFQTTTQAGSQPSLFQTSQTSNQPSVFQTSQTSSQPSLFQTSQTTSQPLLFQMSQANSQPLLFQGSQASSQPSSIFQMSQGSSQSALFQISQASTQSSLFQTSQTNQLSLFQTPQSNTQPSIFQTSQAGPQPSALLQAPTTKPPLYQATEPPKLNFQFQNPLSSSGQSTLFNFSASTPAQSTAQTQSSTMFNAGGLSKPSTFVFGQQNSGTSGTGNLSLQQSSGGSLFGNTTSATATPQSQPTFQFSGNSIGNTGVSFGTPSNPSFNFGSQTATPTQNSTFMFGQANTPPVIQFGGGLNQPQSGGGFNFQTPSAAGNVFNFSRSTGPSTPSSTRRARGRARKK